MHLSVPIFFPIFSPLLKPTTPFSVLIFRSFSVPIFSFDCASSRLRFGPLLAAASASTGTASFGPSDAGARSESGGEVPRGAIEGRMRRSGEECRGVRWSGEEFGGVGKNSEKWGIPTHYF